jgi:hypothetical protein
MTMILQYTYLRLAIALCLGLLARGQAAQDRPELCGNPGASVPLPRGMIISSDQSDGRSELRVEGSPRLVVFPGVMGKVEQVCSVFHNKLILFGLASPALYNIEIVKLPDRSLLDSFYGFDPAIAPNQRWLVRRKFYPTQAVTSEEYLIYDLTQDWAHNRSPSVGRDDMDVVGKVIYPAVKDNEPLYNVNLPAEQTHTFRSDSFLLGA